MFNARALNVAVAAVTNKRREHGQQPRGQSHEHDQSNDHRCRAWSALADLAGLFRIFSGALADSYRPELHYMRGPGPKWRAKHRPPV